MIKKTTLPANAVYLQEGLFFCCMALYIILLGL